MFTIIITFALESFFKGEIALESLVVRSLLRDFPLNRL